MLDVGALTYTSNGWTFFSVLRSDVFSFVPSLHVILSFGQARVQEHQRHYRSHDRESHTTSRGINDRRTGKTRVSARMSRDAGQASHGADEKKGPAVNVRSRTSSSTSSTLSLKAPRTARFAEATSVNSPIEPTKKARNPFAGPPILTQHYTPQPQVSDIGFGYMSSDEIKHTSVEMPMTPKTPMRSALKVPGTPGRFLDPRSPTFNEEAALEKQELSTEKRNAKDLVGHSPTNLQSSSTNMDYRLKRSASASPSSSSVASTSPVPSSSSPCSAQP